MIYRGPYVKGLEGKPFIGGETTWGVSARRRHACPIPGTGWGRAASLGCGQTRSDDLIPLGLSWKYTRKMPLRAQNITVRDEEVAGSNPVTPTL